MQLTWNAGGWFGAQIGCTAWIAVAGALSLFHDVRTGVVVLLLCLAANLVGWQLWRQRARRSCYRSLQLLLVLSGISGCLTIYAIDRAGCWEAIQVGSSVSAGFAYGMLASVVVGLLLMFHLRFGRAETADRGS